MLRHMLIAGLAVGLQACATPPEVKDWRPFQERTFKGVTEDELIDALDVVFQHSRPGKYEFRIAPGRVTATRRVNHFLVLSTVQGTESWTVELQATATEVRAITDVEFVGASLPYATPLSSRPDRPGAYSLLWDRVEYVLGRQSDWVSCDQWRSSEGLTTADLQFLGLCGYMADDTVPPKPRA